MKSKVFKTSYKQQNLRLLVSEIPLFMHFLMKMDKTLGNLWS